MNTCTESPRMTRPVLTVWHGPARISCDLQHIHRLVHAATRDIPGRVLWAQPRRDMLIVQAGAPAAPPSGLTVKSWQASPLPERIPTEIALSLIATPTGFDTPTRKHVPIHSGLWANWLTQKLGAAVDLHEVQAEDLGLRRGHKPDMMVTHRWVGFSATGTVRDAAGLAGLRDQGVGRGKAYGCGLLLIGPRP